MPTHAYTHPDCCKYCTKYGLMYGCRKEGGTLTRGRARVNGVYGLSGEWSESATVKQEKKALGGCGYHEDDDGYAYNYHSTDEASEAGSDSHTTLLRKERKIHFLNVWYFHISDDVPPSWNSKNYLHNKIVDVLYYKQR